MPVFRSPSASLRSASRATVAAILVTTAWSTPAVAAPTEDAQVSAEFDKIMATDVADANFGQARRRLRLLVDRCKKKANACSPQTTAKVQIELGIVVAQMGQKDQAAAAFGAALEADPDATIAADADVTESVRKVFAEARAAYEATHARADDPYKVVWQNRTASGLYAEGMAAQKAADFPTCVTKMRGALAAEDQAGARLRLAECEEKTGKIIDSLTDARMALEQAVANKDPAVAKGASERVDALLPRLGRVTFVTPQHIANLKVFFDDRLVPPEKLASPVVVDPGSHKIHAEGTLAGTLGYYDETLEVKDGEALTVHVEPKSTAITPGQLACILAAKNESEIAQCLPKKETNLNIRATGELSGYTDSQRVQVVSPYVTARVASPTQGWSVGGSYMLDVVSAASADVVSLASRRFQDYRHAGSLFGGFKVDRWKARGNGTYSSERDYTSRSGFASVAVDLAEGQFTPEIGYGLSVDTIGRAGVPFDVFSNSLTTNSLRLGATLIVSPRTLFVFGGSGDFERGDQSKPYRYIPMFAPGTNVPNAASVDYVNSVRLPVRPLEQLPLERDRFAVAGRMVSRIRPTVTLRIDERLYTDSWGIKGSTTDFRYIVDVGSRLRVWPTVHLHLQTAASFYERAYFASGTPDGVVKLPVVRTTDRELGPLISPTVGGGVRYSLTSPDSKFQMGLSLQGNVMYTKYLDAIYTGSKTAAFGTAGFDMEVE